MKKFQVWFGMVAYFEMYAVSRRELQQAILANTGRWIMDDKIKEVE